MPLLRECGFAAWLIFHCEGSSRGLEMTASAPPSILKLKTPSPPSFFLPMCIRKTRSFFSPPGGLIMQPSSSQYQLLPAACEPLGGRSGSIQALGLPSLPGFPQ